MTVLPRGFVTPKSRRVPETFLHMKLLVNDLAWLIILTISNYLLP